MAQTAEVVMIGGGMVGASIAYHLRQDGMPGRILSGARSSASHQKTSVNWCRICRGHLQTP
jgi:glycine/D-amino acid oxidase-like deaminating enzyme